MSNQNHSPKAMRNLRITFLVIFLTSLISLKAQSPLPEWAPDRGYRLKIRHIYFPEYNFYYDTQRMVYIYPLKNHWGESDTIPAPFKINDLKNTAKVQLRTNTDAPQTDNLTHVQKYKNKKNPRDNRDTKMNTPQIK